LNAENAIGSTVGTDRSGGLAAGEDELLDADAGREGDELLLDAQQDLVSGPGDRLSLVFGHLAHRHGVAATQVAELAVKRFALLLEGSHRGALLWRSHASATLPR
jgi:hypothetical protein